MDERGHHGSIAVEPLDRTLSDVERLQKAIWSFSTRPVSRDQSFTVNREPLRPRAGDLVLARLDVPGLHSSLETRTGRMRNLLPGDEIVAVYGDCYAPNQFDAIVPKTIGPCQLVARSGIAAKALAWRGRSASGPTLITPVGFLLSTAGERVNLRDFGMSPLAERAESHPMAIAVFGTSADSGTTSSAAFLARGLIRSGLRVGYAKVTGTAAGRDMWLLQDAGAGPVLDFTDIGYVSTYRLSAVELEGILVTLAGRLAHSGVDVMLLEFADGLLQPESAALLKSPKLRTVADGALLAANDAMGAIAGVRRLFRHGLPVAGISGVLSASPLQGTEARAETGLPTYTDASLGRAPVGRAILAKIRKSRKTNGADDACSSVPTLARELAVS